MAVEELNAKGGVLGKKIELAVVDPASDWDLFAEKAKQLLLQDERRYPGDSPGHRFTPTGPPYPIAWSHEYAGGRAWFTGLGCRPEIYSDPAFLNHLAGGILWAAGR